MSKKKSEERKLRRVESITIKIPALPRLSAEAIFQRFKNLRSIEKDESPEGEVVLTFSTVLEEREHSISLERNGYREYEIRLQGVEGKLGLSQALWLEEHQDEFPELMAFLVANQEGTWELRDETFIVFPATICVDEKGERSFPRLTGGDNGDRWHTSWLWICCGFDVSDRIAASVQPYQTAK